MAQYLALFNQAFTAVLGWFTDVMDKSDVGPIYLACVFISLAIGFLLSNFGNAFSSGSDKAAELYKRRRD